ncbi:MAG: helix-turn-helix domain-containing protein [Anaerolineales bacterium]
MAEGLGLWLRRSREARNMTLDEAEQALRIRRRYLQALEMGDYTALPGPIQARGFLRNYARLLGLPVEEALARYEAEVEGRPLQPRRQPVREAQARQWADRPSQFPPPPTEEEELAAARSGSQVSTTLMFALLGLAVFFGLVALGAFVYLQLQGRNPEPVPAATLPAVEEPVVETPAQAEGPVFVPAIDGTINVRLEPREHVWVRLVADETVVFQGVAGPGEVVQAGAEERILVETGNGGGFRLFVNGEDWGLLGAQGEVVRRSWTPAGEVPVGGP